MCCRMKCRILHRELGFDIHMWCWNFVSVRNISEHMHPISHQHFPHHLSRPTSSIISQTPTGQPRHPRRRQHHQARRHHRRLRRRLQDAHVHRLHHRIVRRHRRHPHVLPRHERVQDEEGLNSFILFFIVISMLALLAWIERLDWWSVKRIHGPLAEWWWMSSKMTRKPKDLTDGWIGTERGYLSNWLSNLYDILKI